MTLGKVKIVGPRDGAAGFLGSIGVRWMIDGAEAGNRFALVEHPMSPRALAAPMHKHAREDEYSFVLEGKLGALLDDEVVFGKSATLSSSLAINGTRSGMRGTSLREFWRSSRQPVSKSSFGRWSRQVV